MHLWTRRPVGNVPNEVVVIIGSVVGVGVFDRVVDVFAAAGGRRQA